MSNGQLLYVKLVNYLKNQIESGELKVNDKLPTELEMAELFKVSRITSKRAFEELRAEGLIYRKRGSGSYVAEKKNEVRPVRYKAVTGVVPTDIKNIVSIVLPFDASSGGLMETINGASQVLNKYGYFLSIHSSGRNIYKEKELLNNLFEQQVGGVILYPISDRENLELMNKFHLANYPLITIDKYYESIPICCVISDNNTGCYEATKHLIGNGHKKIGFISDVSIEEATSVRNRYFGYCRALAESELSIDEKIIKTGLIKSEINPLDEDARELLIEKELNYLISKGMTAVVCVNDYVAATVMKVAINRLGLRLPKDLSIVGFDNIEIAAHLQVPLTSVAQDFHEMGKRAAELLLESINDSHEYSKVVLPCKLVERASSI